MRRWLSHPVGSPFQSGPASGVLTQTYTAGPSADIVAMQNIAGEAQSASVVQTGKERAMPLVFGMRAFERPSVSAVRVLGV